MIGIRMLLEREREREAILYKSPFWVELFCTSGKALLGHGHPTIVVVCIILSDCSDILLLYVAACTLR